MPSKESDLPEGCKMHDPSRAAANGFDLKDWDTADIVCDLMAFDADAEDDTPDNLFHHVAAWQESRR